MPRRASGVAVVAVLGMLAAGCAGDRPTLAEQSTTNTTTTTTAAPPDADGIVGAERRATELDDAVANLIEAGSYRFEAEVSLLVGQNQTELQIDGWVHGADRELILRNGDTAATTRVIDGVATVERNGEITQVPLETAATAPTLEILTQITNVSYAPGDTLRGRLSSAALTDVGFDVEGSARVTAVITNGELSRYSITADNGAWSIRSEFSNIGNVQR